VKGVLNIMAERLIDKFKNREEIEANEQTTGKKSAVRKILNNNGEKDKQISAKVNGELYSEFARINRLQGVSNNSIINQLIFKYVRENRGILDEEN
jgi:hypothetical protein